MIQNFDIKSSITGKKIPLKEFATIGYTTKLDTIHTYNRNQTITVLADSAPGANSTLIENYIESNILPTLDTSGSTMTFDGEREDIKKNFGIVGMLQF